MTALETPNFTQVPNVLFEQMASMSDAELRCTLVLIRQIFGYHREKPEPISNSQIEEMSGLSHQGVINGMKAALERGHAKHAGTGQRGVNLYTLNIKDQSTSLTSQKRDQSTRLTRSSQRRRPVLVNDVDTPNKKKEKKEKNMADAPTAVSAGEPLTSTTPPAEPVQESPAVKPPRPRDPIYDDLAAVWFDTPPGTPAFQALGGRIGSHVSWLKGNAIKVKRNGKPIPVDGCPFKLSKEDLMRARRDWYQKYPDAHHPTDVLKFIEWISSWQNQRQHPAPVTNPLAGAWQRADPACPICHGQGTLVQADREVACTCLKPVEVRVSPEVTHAG